MNVDCFTDDDPRGPSDDRAPGFVILLVVFFLGGVGLMLLPSWIEWLLR